MPPLIQRQGNRKLGGGLVAAALLLVVLSFVLGTGVAAAISFLGAPFILAAGVIVAVGKAGRRAYARLAAAAVPLFIVSVVAHNVFYGVTNIEEPVFLITGIIVAPALLLAGAVGFVLAGRGRSGDAHGGSEMARRAT